jgi:hypothetical protein
MMLLLPLELLLPLPLLLMLPPPGLITLVLLLLPVLPAVAFSVSVAPTHIVEGVALAVIAGNALTVTLIICHADEPVIL